MKKRQPDQLKALLKDILIKLREINQKVEHVIRRLPKNDHPYHDPHWNNFND